MRFGLGPHPRSCPRRAALASTVLLALAIMAGLAASAQAQTIEVNTTEDPTGAGSCGDGGCSLRQAVESANSGDTIKLDGSGDAPMTYKLTQGSQIVVNKELTIEGNGPEASVIDGSENIGPKALNRIMKITGGPVTIKKLQFADAQDGEDEQFEDCSPCDTINANGGGALFADGPEVNLENVEFDGDGISSGQPTGGAVANDGTLKMSNVLFAHDNAAIGGALFLRGGTVTGEDLTFEEDGTSAFDGGAVFLLDGGHTTLTNTTIVSSGWPSSFGGGIDNDSSTLTLINDTLAGNARGSLETDSDASTSVENTILGSGFSDGVNFDCVGAGKENDVDTVTAAAITHDLGNNIDQDGACGADDASGDLSKVDPDLAPIAENGGPLPTQALLHGSPAIDAANEAACPATDARGIPRPQGAGCDIGAYEAVLLGQPSATTDAATGSTSSEATLAATIDLDGEGGGFHFVFGLSSSRLNDQSPEVGAGDPSTATPESEVLAGLSPETTYYFRAVADNASGSVPASNVLSFITQEGAPGAPKVSEPSVESVTETTATIGFTIDPDGTDTSYVVNYGSTSEYGSSTSAVDIGSTGGEKRLTRTLSGLQAGNTYHFDIVATSPEAVDGVEGEDQQLTTESPGGAGGSPPGGSPGGGGESPSGGGSSPPPSGSSPIATAASTGASTAGTGSAPSPAGPLPPPVLGKAVNVTPVSGIVYIELPPGATLASAASVSPFAPFSLGARAVEALMKGQAFIPLTEARQIPVGSILETTGGVVGITTATTASPKGKLQTGNFGGGIFKLLQNRKQKGLTDLDIVDNHGASQVCATVGKRGKALAAKLSSKTLGRVNASGHGHFAVRGQYSAAAVRGTVWSVANRCEGTLTHVVRGVVSVRDFRRRKTITLFTGESYLARAPIARR